MSILIKGMMMPPKGEYHITLYVTNGYAYADAWSLPTDDDRFEAVEIPPHGRLIDADALTNIINQSITEQEKVFNSINEDPIGKHGIWIDIMHDKRITGILGNAPTIIEAEE